MFLVKQKVSDEIFVRYKFNPGVINLGKAIYWLKDLRTRQDDYLLNETQPDSWLEIDGVRISESVLLHLDNHKQRRKFIKSFFKD